MDFLVFMSARKIQYIYMQHSTATWADFVYACRLQHGLLYRYMRCSHGVLIYVNNAPESRGELQ